MIVTREGKVADAVEIDDNKRLFDCFRVRVIKETISNGIPVRKDVIGEEDFKDFPNEEQIMYCIAKYNGDFAAVERIYALEALPFSECTDCEPDKCFMR